MAYSTEEIDIKNRSFAADIKSAAFGALGQLESAALGVAFSGAVYDAKTVSDMPSLDKPDINSLPTVAALLSAVQAIHADPFPQAPATDDLLKYKKHIWESQQFDDIQNLLTAYMADMGLPSQTFQDAVFDADRERKQRTLNDAIELVKATTSGRGFKYANVQTAAGINELVQKHQFDQENQSRKITEVITDMARQNLQFAVQQGIAVEQSHMDFAYKYSSIFREIYTTQITAILEKYRTGVQMELAKIEGVTRVAGIRADVEKARADISATEGRLKLEKDKLEIDQALGEFRLTIEDMKNRASAQIEAAGKRAVVSGELMKAVTSSVLGVSISKTTA